MAFPETFSELGNSIFEISLMKVLILFDLIVNSLICIVNETKL
jgi:hypothetical protein